MSLASLVRRELIFPALPGLHREVTLRAVAERIVAAGVTVAPDELLRKLLEREELGSTCVRPGVAIPHCKLDGLKEVVVSIGLCPEGVAFGEPEDEPVRLLFTLVSPTKDPARHLQALALVSRWLKDDGHVESLLALEDVDAILDLLAEPPPEEAS